jgi:hypothetical protein
MGSHPLNRRQLSRSKLDLFLDCPRCFHEDVVRGVAALTGYFTTGYVPGPHSVAG